jgi:hypothetical protein
MLDGGQRGMDRARPRRSLAYVSRFRDYASGFLLKRFLAYASGFRLKRFLAYASGYLLKTAPDVRAHAQVRNLLHEGPLGMRN